MARLGVRLAQSLCTPEPDHVPEEVPLLQLVEKVLEVIRPALQADGGDIVLRGVDEETGVVTVTLVGACGTCPASSQTLHGGVERILRDRVDGVTSVVAVD